MWLVYAILAAILWGLNYSLAEKLLQSISPIFLLAVEMLFGAILFLGISYKTQFKHDIALLSANKGLSLLMLVEIITVIVASLFIVYSIQAKNATVAGIVELTYPLFTILFTAILFHESHLNLPVIVGGCLILIGVVIISLG